MVGSLRPSRVSIHKRKGVHMKNRRIKHAVHRQKRGRGHAATIGAAGFWPRTIHGVMKQALQNGVDIPWC